MVVDDEKEVHAATRLILKDSVFFNRGVELANAFSGEEAIELITARPETALIFLDVVMETDDAGLKVTRYIREELKNHDVQIILRTGQAGQVPPEEIITRYAINDYKEKTELTSARIVATVTSALRTYNAFQERRSAEAKLHALNEELETHVHERTLELRTANEQLRLEMKEREQLQKQLIASERLAAVGTLSGGVAHEFNNINVSVLGYAELILLTPNLPKVIADGLDKIRTAALRAKAITGNLMSFSTPSHTARKSVDLRDLADEMIALVKDEFASEGIRFEKMPGEKTLCMMDKHQVNQVILNLFTNARHAMIKSDQKLLTVTVGQTGELGFLRVDDTGCGIHRHDLEKVFLPFFSRKGEKARGITPLSDVKGTGLGLSVSHTIITAHEGSILVESTEGKGSSFIIQLPLLSDNQPVEDAQEERKAVTLADSTPTTILVLEDEPDVSDFLTILLTRMGHTVTATASGREALDLIQAESFSMVLCDIQMPEMTGFEFIQCFRQLSLTLPPVIVAVTGKVMDPDSEEERILNTEFDRLIHKPFEVHEIESCIQEAISLHRSGTIG